MQPRKAKKRVKKRKEIKSQSNDTQYVPFPSLTTVSLNLAKYTKESLLNLWFKTQITAKRQENQIKKTQEEPNVPSHVADKSEKATTSFPTASSIGATTKSHKKKKKALNRRVKNFRALAKELIKEFKYFSRFEEKQPNGNRISFKNTLRWTKKAKIVDNHRVTIPDIEVHFINTSKSGYDLNILNFIRFLKSLCEDRGLAISSVILKLLSCRNEQIDAEEAKPTANKAVGKCKVKYTYKKKASGNYRMKKKCPSSRISTLIGRIVKETLSFLPEASDILGQNKHSSTDLKHEATWIIPSLQSFPFPNKDPVYKDPRYTFIGENVNIFKVGDSISTKETENKPEKSYSCRDKIVSQNNVKDMTLAGKPYSFTREENYECTDLYQISDELRKQYDAANQRFPKKCLSLNESSPKSKCMLLKEMKSNSEPKGKMFKKPNKKTNAMNEDTSSIIFVQRIDANSKTEENAFDFLNTSKITMEEETRREKGKFNFDNHCNYECSLKVINWMDKHFIDLMLHDDKNSKQLKSESIRSSGRVKFPRAVKAAGHEKAGFSSQLKKNKAVSPKKEKIIQSNEKINNTQEVELVSNRNKNESFYSNFRKKYKDNKSVKKEDNVSPSRNIKKSATPKLQNKSTDDKQMKNKQSDESSPPQNIDKNLPSSLTEKLAESENTSSRKGNGFGPSQNNDKNKSSNLRSKSARKKETSNKQVVKFGLLGNDGGNVFSSPGTKSTDDKKIMDKRLKVGQSRKINKKLTGKIRCKSTNSKKISTQQNDENNFPRDNDKTGEEPSNKQNDELSLPRNIENVSSNIRKKRSSTKMKKKARGFARTTPKNTAKRISSKVMGKSMHCTDSTNINGAKPLSRIKKRRNISCYYKRKPRLSTNLNKAKEEIRSSKNINSRSKSPLKKPLRTMQLVIDPSKNKQLATALKETRLQVQSGKTRTDCKSEQKTPNCQRNVKEIERTFTNLPGKEVQKKPFQSKMLTVNVKNLKLGNVKSPANYDSRKTNNEGQTDSDEIHSSYPPWENIKTIVANGSNSKIDDDTDLNYSTYSYNSEESDQEITEKIV